MKIDYTHKKYSTVGNILRGPKAGTPRYYLDALYNSLVELKPKLCLEIGTHFGDSAKVFQAYFDEYMPDGMLITCDIKEYTDLSSMKNVKFIKVHPHKNNMTTHHMVTNEELLKVTEFSCDDNIDLVMDTFSIDPNSFDFVFIDGDHQIDSFCQDLLIAQTLKKPDSWILVDDTVEEYHELAGYFQKFRKSDYWEVYDFDDWEVLAGASLLREKCR